MTIMMIKRYVKTNYLINCNYEPENETVSELSNYITNLTLEPKDGK